MYYYSSKYIQMKLVFGTATRIHRAVWTKADYVSAARRKQALPWKEVLKTTLHASCVLLQTVGRFQLFCLLV